MNNDLGLAVFESSLRENFHPLTLTRPSFDICYGTGTLLKGIERLADREVTDFFVPKYLEDLTKETHPRARVNEFVSRRFLAVNSLVSHKPEIWRLIQEESQKNSNFMYFDSSKVPLFGILDEINPKLMEITPYQRKITPKSLPTQINSDGFFKFPWRLVETNHDAITGDYSRYSSSGQFNGDCEKLGNRISVSPTAEVERFVTLDSRSGPIVIDDHACIQSFSHLTGPCYFGKNTIVKSAKVRGGTTVSDFCRISGEVEQSIFSEYTNKNHDGFVGHSIIGSWVNLGAMTTNSDLKNTYGEIKVTIGGKKVNSESTKVGVFIGDMVKTGIGSMIGCGKVIGVSSHVLGEILDSVPSFTYHSSPPSKSVEIYLESALKTQSRMMERRGIQVSKAFLRMMETVFKLTKKDRAAHKVHKGKMR